MDSSHNVNFGNCFIVKLFYNAEHFFVTVFPAVTIAVRLVVGTESAIINANICGFNMKITVEVCEIVVVSAPDNPGK